MPSLLETLLPARADNTLRGSQIPLYVFAAIACIGTVRSLIHMFSSDGGAGSIAGMDLSVAGAGGIIFAFALWGSSQLLYAMIQLVVAIRYRSLVPLMYVVQLAETLLRMLVGRLKPVTFAHTPPGKVGNYVFLPLCAAMLAVTLMSGKEDGK